MKIRDILFFLLTIFFFSCNGNENNIKVNEKILNKGSNDEVLTSEEVDRKLEIEELNKQKIIKTIANQFNASYAFDTVRYKMTYQYQNLLQKNDRVIIDRFKITNIEAKDSNYIVSIVKGLSRKMFIEFTCNKNQIENLCNGVLTGEKINTNIYDKFLVLKINSIKKIKLIVESSDAPGTFVEIDASDGFFCNGEYINVIKK